MNALTSLPFELQDYIYSFDGRYKKAMDLTLKLIRQWGKTQVAMRLRIKNRKACEKACEKLDGVPPDDLYYLELCRRRAQYRRHLCACGSINRSRRPYSEWGNWNNPNSEHANPTFFFRDIFGLFKVSKEPKKKIINGEEYHSVNKFFDVNMVYSYSRLIDRTTRRFIPKVSRLDLFDTDLQKKLKRRKNPAKAFLDYGLSPNGTQPVKPQKKPRKVKTPVPEVNN